MQGGIMNTKDPLKSDIKTHYCTNFLKYRHINIYKYLNEVVTG